VSFGPTDLRKRRLFQFTDSLLNDAGANCAGEVDRTFAERQNVRMT
jgi:hypothetical protein